MPASTIMSQPCRSATNDRMVFNCNYSTCFLRAFNNQFFVDGFDRGHINNTRVMPSSAALQLLSALPETQMPAEMTYLPSRATAPLPISSDCGVKVSGVVSGRFMRKYAGPSHSRAIFTITA